MGSSQCFTRVEKIIRPIRIAKDVFSRVRLPIKNHRTLRVSRQNFDLCSMQRPHFASCLAELQREKTTNLSFSCNFFRGKK